jgi:hypothetical protein
VESVKSTKGWQKKTPQVSSQRSFEVMRCSASHPNLLASKQFQFYAFMNIPLLHKKQEQGERKMGKNSLSKHVCS